MFRTTHKSDHAIFAFLDIDNTSTDTTAVYKNKMMFKLLKAQGITDLVFFTSMFKTQISLDLQPATIYSRHTLIKESEKEGFVVHQVITPMDYYADLMPGTYFEKRWMPAFEESQRTKVNDPLSDISKIAAKIDNEKDVYDQKLNNDMAVMSIEERAKFIKANSSVKAKMFELAMKHKDKISKNGKKIGSIIYFDDATDELKCVAEVNIQNQYLPLTCVEVHASEIGGDIAVQYDDNLKSLKEHVKERYKNAIHSHKKIAENNMHQTNLCLNNLEEEVKLAVSVYQEHHNAEEKIIKEMKKHLDHKDHKYLEIIINNVKTKPNALEELRKSCRWINKYCESMKEKKSDNNGFSLLDLHNKLNDYGDIGKNLLNIFGEEHHLNKKFIRDLNELMQIRENEFKLKKVISTTTSSEGQIQKKQVASPTPKQITTTNATTTITTTTTITHQSSNDKNHELSSNEQIQKPIVLNTTTQLLMPVLKQEIKEKTEHSTLNTIPNSHNEEKKNTVESVENKIESLGYATGEKHNLFFAETIQNLQENLTKEKKEEVTENIRYKRNKGQII